MNQQQLLEALTAVKTNVDTVNTTLATIAASQTEATTEILAKLEELSHQDLSPEVQTIVDELTTATQVVITGTENINAQAKTLADIVPNPEPPPEARR